MTTESNRIVFPIAIANQAELAYAQYVRSISTPMLARILEVYDTHRRADALPRDLSRLIKELEDEAVSEQRLEQIASVAASVGRSFDRNNRIQVGQQIQAILGASFVGISPTAQRTLEQFIKSNVRFIRKLGRRTRQQVFKVLDESFAKRTATETVARQLVERVGIAENHARLIARDQGNKFFGKLTRARHNDAGASEYIWQTSADERVRASHSARNGNTYSYTDSPIPGEEIQCRCTAVPVFPGL